jgi:hypothetical protein
MEVNIVNKYKVVFHYLYEFSRGKENVTGGLAGFKAGLDTVAKRTGPIIIHFGN